MRIVTDDPEFSTATVQLDDNTFVEVGMDGYIEFEQRCQICGSYVSTFTSINELECLVAFAKRFVIERQEYLREKKDE